jgi:hypothetical protein
MKQCKALLKKEWQTHWRTILTPLLFLAVIYVTILLSLLINLIKHGGITRQSFVSFLNFGLEAPYWISMSVTTLLGFVHMVSGIILADGLINGDHKRQCQIFHFSQPLPFVKIAGTKYLFACIAPILMLAATSFVNVLVVNLWIGFYKHTYFWMGMMGWLQTLISVGLSILFVSSLAWFFAGIFKRKSFPLGILCLLGIEIILQTLNYMVGWHIPSLMENLMKLINMNVSTPAIALEYTKQSITRLVRANWQDVFSTVNVLKIGFSAVFGVLGALLYKRRELR